ncbi:MAG TPA: bifunctional phosphoribosylaminoimidazolecarboxamide formyltransferase/IMP cyclohydrolase [bacterium]|nr:bifunctional phosphoribosylaminoimidazolecarboxamide formyltransferase/IMP cyclohydrolase [bacterium]
MEQVMMNKMPDMAGIVPVRRALISVWEKAGLQTFAATLAALGIEMVTTGGTADALRQSGISVTTIESLTGYPAILDGRVKTLHPAIFGAILARDEPAHQGQLAGLGIAPVDLVVVNLYPFESRGLRASMAEAMELIDIGGVSLLRAAAKNWTRVAVVCDPSQYERVADELRRTRGLSADTRCQLAADAFARTAAYDAVIAGYFNAAANVRFPDRLTLSWRKVQQTRYGENPHQAAAFYQPSTGGGTLSTAHVLQGKELSFNNLVDLDAAWGLVNEFPVPTAAIIKHATPCGAATASALVDAYTRALACDPVSAFGGVVAVNCPLDEETAAAIGGIFTEAVIAPAFSPEARALLQKKANLRLLEAVPPVRGGTLEIKSLHGDLLVQEDDRADLDSKTLTVATSRAPSTAEMADLHFAWTVVKWVKSNAIVLARGGATVGIGAGQPNRVGAVEIAVKGAGDRARGAVMASDAFFPFRDGVDVAARAGVTAVIQPGGSVKDSEVIAATNEQGVAMVLTGVRHFRH